MHAHIHVAAASAALALAAISLVGCAHETKAPEKRPIPVKVKTVAKSQEIGLARYSGSLEPVVRVDMAFRVGGYVEALGEVTEDGKRRPLEVGDFVKKGALLARIRSSEYAQKVATTRAQVSEARSEMRLAEAELLRSKKLLETRAITQAEFDARDAKAEWARANVDGAVARSGEAGVALDDTVLKAPMDGVILSRDVEIGALISPGKPVITVADTRTVKAAFAVPQALVEKLSLGSPVQVHVGPEGEGKGADKLLDAKVTRIAPAADSKGRVFAVEAALQNEAGALRPGAVISVHIPESTLSVASLSVPLSAVVRAPSDPRGFSVFVLDGDANRTKARLRVVKLGEVLGNSVTVSEGLALGQRVVTVGATLIQDGSETVVIP